MKFFEVNFDGLVGPTHNYAGLSSGNLASEKNFNQISNPKAAALQGLEKMKFVYDLGLKQAYIPPAPRPDLAALITLGYCSQEEITKLTGPSLSIFGNDSIDITQVSNFLMDLYNKTPEALAQISSASSMWTANAATVSPSLDTEDAKVHLTVANLSSKKHRSIEADYTYSILSKIFTNEQYFRLHPAISPCLGDEGAANHSRLCPSHSNKGLELFTFGKVQDKENTASLKMLFPELCKISNEELAQEPQDFVARQDFEASLALTFAHQTRNHFFAKQNPQAIDAGVFHNDVIAVANENVLLYHEEAFAQTAGTISNLRARYQDLYREELHCIEANSQDFSLEDAVSSYIFNSQLITVAPGEMQLIAPQESQNNPKTKAFVDKIISRDNPISQVHYLDLRQSMCNGGGPACLRLRVVLSEEELAAVNQDYIFDEAKYQNLKDKIESRYPDEFELKDICSKALLAKLISL